MTLARSANLGQERSTTDLNTEGGVMKAVQKVVGSGAMGEVIGEWGWAAWNKGGGCWLTGIHEVLSSLQTGIFLSELCTCVLDRVGNKVCLERGHDYGYFLKRSFNFDSWKKFHHYYFCFFYIHSCEIVMGGEREALVKRLSPLPWFLSHWKDERQTGEMRYVVYLWNAYEHKAAGRHLVILNAPHIEEGKLLVSLFIHLSRGYTWVLS